MTQNTAETKQKFYFEITEVKVPQVLTIESNNYKDAVAEVAKYVSDMASYKTDVEFLIHIRNNEQFALQNANTQLFLDNPFENIDELLKFLLDKITIKSKDFLQSSSGLFDAMSKGFQTLNKEYDGFLQEYFNLEKPSILFEVKLNEDFDIMKLNEAFKELDASNFKDFVKELSYLIEDNVYFAENPEDVLGVISSKLDFDFSEVVRVSIDDAKSIELVVKPQLFEVEL